MDSEEPGRLRSALEIALEKHERHQDLSAVRAEIEEHIKLLEECWTAIRPGQQDGGESSERELPRRLAA